MITIEYSKNGKPTSDFNTESLVLDVIKEYLVSGKDKYINVSNELIIEFFRISILEGKIDNELIRFLYNGEYIHPNEDGKIDHWPKGFCNHSLSALERLLACKKRT